MAKKKSLLQKLLQGIPALKLEHIVVDKLDDDSVIKLNPQNWRKSGAPLDDIIASLRDVGYNPHESTGGAEHILAYLPEEGKGLVILRGERRLRSYRRMMKQDATAESHAKAKAAFAEKHPDLAFRRIVGEGADILPNGKLPVLVYHTSLTPEQIDCLIRDEDSGQEKKTARECFAAWKRWVGRGYGVLDANNLVGLQGRNTVLEWLVKLPALIESAWQGNLAVDVDGEYFDRTAVDTTTPEGKKRIKEAKNIKAFSQDDVKRINAAVKVDREGNARRKAEEGPEYQSTLTALVDSRTGNVDGPDSPFRSSAKEFKSLAVAADQADHKLVAQVCYLAAELAADGKTPAKRRDFASALNAIRGEVSVPVQEPVQEPVAA